MSQLYTPILSLTREGDGFTLYAVTYVANSCIKSDGQDKKAPGRTPMITTALPISLKIKTEGITCLTMLMPVIHTVSLSREELEGRSAIVAFCVQGGSVLGSSELKIKPGSLESASSEPTLIATAGIFPWPDVDHRTAERSTL